MQLESVNTTLRLMKFESAEVPAKAWLGGHKPQKPSDYLYVDEYV